MDELHWAICWWVRQQWLPRCPELRMLDFSPRYNQFKLWIPARADDRAVLVCYLDQAQAQVAVIGPTGTRFTYLELADPELLPELGQLIQQAVDTWLVTT